MHRRDHRTFVDGVDFGSIFQVQTIFRAIASSMEPSRLIIGLGMVLVLMGTGMGMSMVSMLIAVQNRFPRSYLGIATSATQFFRTIGASIGIAIMGAVMAGQMMSGLSALEATEQTEQIAYVARHPDMIVNPLNRAQISPDLLPKLQELLGMQLMSIHNVYTMNRLMREVRAAIAAGTL